MINYCPCNVLNETIQATLHSLGKPHEIRTYNPRIFQIYKLPQLISCTQFSKSWVVSYRPTLYLVIIHNVMVDFRNALLLVRIVGARG